MTFIRCACLVSPLAASGSHCRRVDSVWKSVDVFQLPWLISFEQNRYRPKRKYWTELKRMSFSKS